MPGNFKNQDLRIQKTKKVIFEAFNNLINQRKFTRITVNDLCEEAQLSRVTFYSHFQDKYDLLRRLLANIKKTITSSGLLTAEEKLNYLVTQYRKPMKNLMENANEETIAILSRFILSLIDIPEEKNVNGDPTLKIEVLSNFCMGGILSLLTWQLSKSPQEIQMTGKYLNVILDRLLYKGNAIDV